MTAADYGRDVRRLYRAMLLAEGDPRRQTMLVLADALEEGGHLPLARAYRWAAGRGHWPYRDHRQEPRGAWPAGVIHDWDSETRGSWRTPPSSWLPPRLHEAICRLPRAEKRYGGVNRAFVLLAKGLDALAARGVDADAFLRPGDVYRLRRRHRRSTRDVFLARYLQAQGEISREEADARVRKAQAGRARFMRLVRRETNVGT